MELAQQYRRAMNWPPEIRSAVDIPTEFLHDKLELYKDFRDDFRELGLLSSLDQVERIIKRFATGQPLPALEYAEMMQALMDRLTDETTRQQFFMVPSHKLQYYEEASTLFGAEVNKAFPTAQSDIENAAKCYAFGRNTASVFHLMRIIEVGLRVVGKSLNDPNFDPKRNPSWDGILRRCDDELKKRVPDRSPEWRTDNQFFADVAANLRAVKDAWRNPTMHVERDYDEDEALSIGYAVSSPWCK